MQTTIDHNANNPGFGETVRCAKPVTQISSRRGSSTITRSRTSTVRKTELERLKGMRLDVAKLVAKDHTFAPIFSRLDAEIELEEAKCGRDIISYARLVSNQRAIL